MTKPWLTLPRSMHKSWPAHCIHDNWGKFIGSEFQLLLEGCRIKDVPTTSKNPQANAICERMHQTVGNILRTLLHGQPPQQITGARAKDFIDKALAITMHAICAWTHSTLGSSPGSLVFNRDMFLNIPLIADWHAVTNRREHLVNENLISHDYAVDHRVLKKRHNPTKLGPQTTGPYRVIQTHVNSTVMIELQQGGIENINMRRIIPYKE